MMPKMRLAVLLTVVLFLTVEGSLFSPPEAAGESLRVDDIDFTMPSAWVAKSEPGVKAAYTFFFQGKPYAEMFLTKETLDSQKTAAQALDEGLRKNSANIQGYRPVQTNSITVAGTDASIHDFSYFLPQTPVQFTGRVLVIVLNNAAYTFFFNTTSGYFPYVKGSFSEVVGSIRAVEKTQDPTEVKIPGPAELAAELATPSLSEPGPPPSDRQGTTGGRRTVEEHCFLLELAPGWQQTRLGLAGGAKYRYYSAEGKYLAGFFPFGTNAIDQSIATMCLPVKSDPLEAVLRRKIANLTPQEEYKEINSERRTIAGCPAIIHDFSVKMTGAETLSMQRYCLIAVKDKPDEGSIMYPPSIYNFMFMSSHDKFEAVKTEYDAILDSMRLAQPLSGVGITDPEVSTVPVSGKTAGAGIRKEQIEQDLPELLETEDEVIFQDPSGRFTVKFPEGVKLDRQANPDFADEKGKVLTYTIPEKEGALIVLYVFDDLSEGYAYRDAMAVKHNARESGETTWIVDGRNVPMKLFSFREGCVFLTALFPEERLFIGVRVQKSSYNESRSWIKDLIVGVRRK
jgi:hypothetical protein